MFRVFGLFLADFLVLLLLLLFLLITQLYPSECFGDREYVDGAFVGGAGNPLGQFVETNRIDLCFVRPTSHFLQWRAVVSRKEPNQGALVGCGSQEVSLEVES